MNQADENCKNKIDPVLSRRSIRKYTDQPVLEDVVTTLLRAAMVAPSADDERPWHFIVVSKKNLLNRIPLIHPFSYAASTAAKAILVCGDESLQKITGFWVQDCAAATENILIEAQISGLGAVWLGIYPIEGRVEGFRSLFNIPEWIIPFSIVLIGYPDENKGPSDRFDISRIHYETW